VLIAEELIDAFLNSPEASGYRVLVADTSGSVAGYVCYGEAPLTRSTWDVYWIAVDRARRGGGVGKTLMAGAEQDIKASGCRLVVIETSGTASYNSTRRFYAAIGYSEVANIADYYDIGDGLVILVKRLG